MKKIKVFLVENHQIIREGLRAILDKETGIEVIGEAGSGREALKLIRKQVPDIVTMAIRLPEMNGVIATHQIRRDHPNVKIIALSAVDSRKVVILILKAGAAGYVLKKCAADELIRAIRSVYGGHTYICSHISDIIVEELVKKSSEENNSKTKELTVREREVLQMISEGYNTKQSARNLIVSVSTIEAHRRRIMSKLDIHSIAGLTKYAISEGITSCEGCPYELESFGHNCS